MKSLITRASLFVVAMATAAVADQGTVDLGTGRLTLSATDLIVGELDVSRSLTEGRAEGGLLGRRWICAWDKRAERGEGRITIHEIGAAIEFTPAQDGTYRSSGGERLAIEADGSLARTRTDLVVENFDASGRLVEIGRQDADRVRLRRDSTGKLTKIEGPEGIVLDVITDPSAKIVAIQASSGSLVRYAYSGDALVEVRVNDGLVTGYAYDEHGNLSAIDDPLEGKIAFRRDPQGRVNAREFADGAREKYEYDAGSRLARKIDPAGGVTTLRWSADGKTREVTDPLRRTTKTELAGGLPVSISGAEIRTRMSYDERGRLAIVEGVNGTSTSFEYLGDSSLPAVVTSADGSQQTFEYDSKGNLRTIRNAGRIVFSAEYTPEGRVAKLGDAAGVLETRRYDAKGRLASAIDRNGGVTRWEYDDHGRTAREIDPGGVTAFQYDARGRLVTRTDAGGGRYRFEYDDRGRLTSATDPLGGATRRKFDGRDRLIEVIDSAGGSMRFAYDARGRMTSSTDPTGETTRYEYDPRGLPLRTVLPGGRTEEYRYDAGGQLIGARDPTGEHRFEYDALGRRIRAELPGGLDVRYRYDAAGNLLGWKDNQGGGQNLRYDSSGRLLEAETSEGAKRLYSYESLGQLASTTDPLGQVTRFEYEGPGELSAAFDPRGAAVMLTRDRSKRTTQLRFAGRQRKVTRDVAGRPISIENEAGGQSKRGYDSAGRLVSRTDAAGKTTRFVYDADGRITERTLADGRKVRFSYDTFGNLLSADDGDFPVRFKRDRSGRVLSAEYPKLGRTLRYEYDVGGRRTRIIDSTGGELKFDYDRAGQLTAIEPWSGGKITLAFDAKGRTSAITYPNGFKSSWSYDGSSRPTSLTDRDRAGKVATQWKQTYDAAGNPVEIAESGGPTVRFKYDPAGELVEELRGERQATRYAYTISGDRLVRDAKAERSAYRYDASGRLTDADAETFRHDANGNLVERRGESGSTRYEYDAEGRLSRVIAADGKDVRFGYAPTGERLWRRDQNGIRYFLFDGGYLLAELDEQHRTAARYAYLTPSRPLFMERGGHGYYFHQDTGGNVRRLSDDRGTVVARYDYDAFGQPIGAKPAVASPFGFAGLERDPSLGLYYTPARYYDPSLGRFLSRDPWSGDPARPLTLNAYVYALNNPLRLADPSGAVPTQKRLGPMSDMDMLQQRAIDNHYQNPNPYVDHNGNVSPGTMGTYDWTGKYDGKTSNFPAGIETYPRGRVDSTTEAAVLSHEGHHYTQDMIDQKLNGKNADPFRVAGGFTTDSLGNEVADPARARTERGAIWQETHNMVRDRGLSVNDPVVQDALGYYEAQNGGNADSARLRQSLEIHEHGWSPERPQISGEPPWTQGLRGRINDAANAGLEGGILGAASGAIICAADPYRRSLGNCVKDAAVDGTIGAAVGAAAGASPVIAGAVTVASIPLTGIAIGKAASAGIDYNKARKGEEKSKEALDAARAAAVSDEGKLKERTDKLSAKIAAVGEKIKQANDEAGQTDIDDLVAEAKKNATAAANALSTAEGKQDSLWRASCLCDGAKDKQAELDRALSDASDKADTVQQKLDSAQAKASACKTADDAQEITWYCDGADGLAADAQSAAANARQLAPKINAILDQAEKLRPQLQDALEAAKRVDGYATASTTAAQKADAQAKALKAKLDAAAAEKNSVRVEVNGLFAFFDPNSPWWPMVGAQVSQLRSQVDALPDPVTIDGFIARAGDAQGSAGEARSSATNASSLVGNLNGYGLCEGINKADASAADAKAKQAEQAAAGTKALRGVAKTCLAQAKPGDGKTQTGDSGSDGQQLPGTDTDDKTQVASNAGGNGDAGKPGKGDPESNGFNDPGEDKTGNVDPGISGLGGLGPGLAGNPSALGAPVNRRPKPPTDLTDGFTGSGPNRGPSGGGMSGGGGTGTQVAGTNIGDGVAGSASTEPRGADPKDPALQGTKPGKSGIDQLGQAANLGTSIATAAGAATGAVTALGNPPRGGCRGGDCGGAEPPTGTGGGSGGGRSGASGGTGTGTTTASAGTGNRGGTSTGGSGGTITSPLGGAGGGKKPSGGGSTGGGGTGGGGGGTGGGSGAGGGTQVGSSGGGPGQCGGGGVFQGSEKYGACCHPGSPGRVCAEKAYYRCVGQMGCGAYACETAAKNIMSWGPCSPHCPGEFAPGNSPDDVARGREAAQQCPFDSAIAGGGGGSVGSDAGGDTGSGSSSGGRRRGTGLAAFCACIHESCPNGLSSPACQRPALGNSTAGMSCAMQNDGDRIYMQEECFSGPAAQPSDPGTLPSGGEGSGSPM